MALMEPFRIDLRSSVPSYRQLAAQLRDRIEAGDIGPDEALPSLVTLVQETGLNVKTIRHAIDLLADEGLVYRVQGRGTFAAPRGG